VLVFTLGEPVDRRVRAILLDTRSGAAADVVAPLPRGAIDSSVELDTAREGQPPIMLEDLIAVDEIVKADSGWQAAVARRGSAELDLVVRAPRRGGPADAAGTAVPAAPPQGPPKGLPDRRPGRLRGPRRAPRAAPDRPRGPAGAAGGGQLRRPAAVGPARTRFGRSRSPSRRGLSSPSTARGRRGRLEAQRPVHRSSETRRMRRLVVSTFVAIGNYDYGFF
jgi:hypothetical protein